MILQCAHEDNIENAKVNSSPSMYEDAFEDVHNFDLPIQIKNLILQMIAYDQKDRIGTFAMYRSLMVISYSLEHQVEMVQDQL